MPKHNCDCCNKIQLTPRRVVFEKPGNTIWSVPQDGWYKVFVTGGGGGSGAAKYTGTSLDATTAGGAGGSGGTAIKDIFLTGGTIVSITVGKGGKGGNGMGLAYWELTAEAGGTSSFGVFCSATGGEGGQDMAGVPMSSIGFSGLGGKGVNGDFNINGQQGCTNISSIKGNEMEFMAPQGGNSYWGGANCPVLISTYSGKTPACWGCGASGATVMQGYESGGNSTTNLKHDLYLGAKGADGVVVIEWTEVQ